ncbi:HD-GYP domain-containing protein [Trichlorobacter ammonificans]|uniref:Response regulator receiver modulated metal dependent phosphohydrolase n=1 Tax=Trichlorobacter ammonificans TaxID=2916410 RepID=A0ABN8HKY5_9BACT|nr:two-component system response regulator [Trichlorobacter ammonificans]CAH2032010.1 Response regulator receiver modulated metal dependent phosphohydrolase [Trichlorobacter ammonificans]
MSESSSRYTILIVDDTPENIALLNAALRDEFSIKVATRGRKAIEIARSLPVDIILLDVMMPEMDGFETCRRLKADPMTRRIPVIFVTARGDVEDESVGFACGGVDYITKPLRYPVVRSRIKTHLALYDQERRLEALVRERTRELAETRMDILQRLGRAAEYRDNETGRHVIRISHYCHLLAIAYGLPEEEADLLRSASTMHDIGKIGIPDRVLLKQGRLDAEERAIIQQHCVIGHEIIGDHSSKLLQTAALVALTHHERWDGTGYPNGLNGEDIPLFSRILALADVFDALTSRRPYKEPWSVAEAVAEITACSGSHFDPAVVRVFLECHAAFEEILRTYADPTPPPEPATDA